MEEKAQSSGFDTNENNEDSGITMLDVLEEEKELEDDANAVLGGSDDQNCTYIEGYVKRQALYACGTCVTNDMEPAGICLACSYACHEGHNLYELYTKRNFRCDCGNSKFPNNPCHLWKTKDKVNAKNNYNSNFHGRYCTCARPYPDPEDDVSDEMIQCIMCEDWYHGRHLGGSVPEGQDYNEMICSLCMEKHNFIWRYQPRSKEVVHMAKEEPASNSPVKVVDESQGEQASETRVPNKEEPKESASASCSTSSSHNSDEQIALVSDCTKSECLWDSLPEEPTGLKGPTFWPEGWRKRLCRCQRCMDRHQLEECSFLLQQDDTVHAYEEQGKAKHSGLTQYDKGMCALNTLDRVKQVEAIHEYNNMKSELKVYLQKFADSKKVVREEDILEFFRSMEARKKQRVDDCQMPHFCR